MDKNEQKNNREDEEKSKEGEKKQKGEINKNRKIINVFDYFKDQPNIKDLSFKEKLKTHTTVKELQEENKRFKNYQNKIEQSEIKKKMTVDEIEQIKKINKIKREQQRKELDDETKNKIMAKDKEKHDLFYLFI